MSDIAINLLQFFGSAILAVLFLQSGLDKVLDFKGNLAWLNGHFANSMFKNSVSPLLLIITILEVFAGVAAAIAAILFAIQSESEFATLTGILGAASSLLSLLFLFIGQRIAKDYAGAGGLVPYMILAGLTLYVVSI